MDAADKAGIEQQTQQVIKKQRRLGKNLPNPPVVSVDCPKGVLPLDLFCVWLDVLIAGGGNFFIILHRQGPVSALHCIVGKVLVEHILSPLEQQHHHAHRCHRRCKSGKVLLFQHRHNHCGQQVAGQRKQHRYQHRQRQKQAGDGVFPKQHPIGIPQVADDCAVRLRLSLFFLHSSFLPLPVS